MKIFLLVLPTVYYYFLCKSMKLNYKLSDKALIRMYAMSTPILILFAYLYNFSFVTLIHSLIISVLIIITAIDLEHRIIPNKLIIILLILGTCNFILTINNYKLLIGGMFFSGTFSIFVHIFSKGGFGGGDVKLLTVLGLVIGYYNVYLLLLLSFFSASLIGLARIVFKKATLKSSMPFGPFITLSFIILSFI